MERSFLLREINSLKTGDDLKDYEGNPARPASGKEGNAELAFSGAHYIIGPNNSTRRLYYVTSGAFGNQLNAKFPVKITNVNSLGLGGGGLTPAGLTGYYLNCFFLVRLSRTRQSKIVSWDAKNTIYKRIDLPKAIAPGTTVSYTLEIPPWLLQAARDMDDNDLSVRLDVEFYWQEKQPDFWWGSTYTNYKNKPFGIAFQLVKPVEYVFVNGKKESVRKEYTAKVDAFIRSTRIHIIRLNAKAKGKLTISKSETKTTANGIENNVTVGNETSEKKEIGVKTAPVPFLKLAEISGSYSYEEKNSISRSYTTQKSFTDESGVTMGTEIDLTAYSGRKKYRDVYLSPIVKAIMVKRIVIYDDGGKNKPNLNGMAMKASVKDGFQPIFVIGGWFLDENNFTDG